VFTGNDPIDRMTSTIAYHHGIQPEDYLVLLKDGIGHLDACVAAARGHRGDPADKKRHTSLNLLLGYGLLAMSESRALLALVSIGLERSARIHFRSLHEYAFRAVLLLDPTTAHQFKLAAARETEKYAKWFKLDAAHIAAATAQYLADADPGESPMREQDALGGDMASLMRKKTGDDTSYATTFGQPSLFAHGSILALYELSEAIRDRGGDLPITSSETNRVVRCFYPRR